MGKRKGKKPDKVDKGEGDKSAHSRSASSKRKHSKNEERDLNATENSDDVNSSEPSTELVQQKALLSEGPPYAVQEKGPAMPPWLTSPVVRMGQRIASLPEGFEMDESFSNRSANFEAPSIVTDMDDDFRHRTELRKDEVHSTTSAGKMSFEEDLSKQGIGLFVEIETDDASLGDYSDLSTSNQSYILDLAMQKESRDKNLKEEALEDALVLFKEARKAGHGSEAFFLIIVAEVQKKLEESQAEFFRLQDERLDQALDEELKRQEAKLNTSGGSPRLGKGGKHERVSVFIEKEKSRRSLDPSMLESSAAAAAEATDDNISLGEYDWDAVRESIVIEKKKKTKVKQSKTSKKDKPLKSGKAKTKKKKNKSLDEQTPTASDKPLPQSAETELKKASDDESSNAQENVEQFTTTNKPSSSKSLTKKPKKKKNKTKESKKAKSKQEGQDGKPSSTGSTHETTKSRDDGSETAETATCTDSATILKRERHGDETSPNDSQDLDDSASVNGEQEEDNPFDSDKKLEGSGRGTNLPVKRKNPADFKNNTSVSTASRAMSNLLSSIFRRKAQDTGGKQTSKLSALFKKKKQKDADDDVSNRLLPIPGSQLQ